MESEAQLEQFCILAKSTKGRAIADLIQKATSQPGIFTFGELLDIPNVKEVCMMCCRPIELQLISSLRESLCLCRSFLKQSLLLPMSSCNCLHMALGRTTEVRALWLLAQALLAHQHMFSYIGVSSAEYQGKISLNSQQELKLKLLTVATMAGASSVRMLHISHACHTSQTA